MPKSITANVIFKKVIKFFFLRRNNLLYVEVIFNENVKVKVCVTNYLRSLVR